MDYDIENNEMWDWQGTNICLQENIESAGMSKCLWSDMKQNQDVSYIFDNEITPVKDCGDLVYYVNNYEMSEKLEKLEEPSSQVKRRRMLQFDSEGLNTPFCNEDTSSSYLRSKDKENSAEEAVSEKSHLVSGYADDTSESAFEALDQSSEGWLASCFTDADSPGDLISDVQIDIEELLNNEPEPAVSTNQCRPARTQRNVFRGRKSYIQTPANSASTVAYPFAFIKPCAVRGDVTLKDINQRIHAPPPSKLKQSYDDPAAYPTSAFSGKLVIGSTKIHTEGGKGSITIMRTKG
ncbi:protein XRI1-like isoform X2 [Coffea eugenioides]|uniref:Protein XRI1 isoform X2 n=1 Tax=Coffea arabica TaxID=13443 RepID=A0A6P6UUR2_COFAR|nr:protein XRI1-like isoform X2 [Coffea eugenioides]